MIRLPCLGVSVTLSKVSRAAAPKGMQSCTTHAIAGEGGAPEERGPEGGKGVRLGLEEGREGLVGKEGGKEGLGEG